MRAVLIITFFVEFGILFCECFAQEVEITVLGVAQDAGHPQAGCDEFCCAKAFHNPALRHQVSSLGISDGSVFYIIDATPDFALQLGMMQHLYPDQRLAGIFITHAHIGHYTGLMQLGREAMSSVDVPVYVMPKMKDFLEKNGPWDQLIRLHNIRLIEMAEQTSLNLGNFSVTPFVVPHRDEYSETVGFNVTGPTRSAVYIPDIDKWERWEQDILSVIRGADYAFLDATFYDGNELPGRNMGEIPHPFVVESVSLFDELAPIDKAKINFIHLNHSNPLLNEASTEFNTILNAGYVIAQQGNTYKL